MIKFEKIEDKELVLVEGQEHCRVVGQPYAYAGQGDCDKDCDAYGKPAYYKSSTH